MMQLNRDTTILFFAVVVLCSALLQLQSSLSLCSALSISSSSDTNRNNANINVNLPLHRRAFVTIPAIAAASTLLQHQTASAALLDERPTQTLPNGVQYSDARLGEGPPIDKKSPVVMHLRALRRDGAVLFDTLEDGDGTPLLHPLGSIVDYNFFGGDSSQRSKVTLGVEDAILGQQGQDPIREGGIRLVVVPGPLAYGHAGVSRYDAYKMGLRKLVPRDEMLRYEIEILRCLDAEQPPEGDQSTATTSIKPQICCRQPDFPCKANNSTVDGSRNSTPQSAGNS